MPPPIGKPFKVLFLCVGNACRSQMAEALARHSAPDIILAQSAGIYPLGEIAELTSAVLNERGIPVDGQTSKSVRPEHAAWADVIVNMTGMPGQALFPDLKEKLEDWDVEDPYGHAMELYEVTCDEIEARVGDLARRLRQRRAQKKKAAPDGA
jgi:arsenate reductase